MAKERDIADNPNVRFTLAFGTHNAGAAESLVRHKQLAVGTELQVTLQHALGAGEWDSVQKVWYNGAELSSDYYRFHPGGSSDAADDLFPDDIAHPGYAYLATRLPVGISTDNDPDKLIVQARCLILEDYDDEGNVTGRSYSANPARVAAYLIKIIRPRILQRVDWVAWCAWRDWCDELIEATVDGETVMIKRMEAHVWITPPFGLEEVLDKLCQNTCSDWQWRHGKIVFLPPVDRGDAFTFDLAQVGAETTDFKFVPIDRRNMVNGVRVSYRNLLDPFLQNAEPIVVKRDELIAANGGVENFLEINLGTAHPSQAMRVANYWARMRCDLATFAMMTGSWKSYPVLPCDLVRVTHDVPDFEDQRFMVVEKEEDEVGGDGYPYKLQIYPNEGTVYSDTDHSPIVVFEADGRPNPLVAPPVPELSLSQQLIDLNDGTGVITVKGTVTGGDFGFRQRFKVQWKRPGSDYEDLDELTPIGENAATFRASRLGTGEHFFRAFAFSDYGLVSAEAEESITISAANFEVEGRIIVNAADRAFTGFDSQGRYRGADTNIVPLPVITAQVIKGPAIDNGVNVDVNVAGEITGARVTQSAQGDSVFQSKVEVYNKFGELVKAFVPDGFTGAGTLGKGTYQRKYADPYDEAIFKITVRNYFGWSFPKYLKGTTLSDSFPSVLSRANVVTELSGSPISSSAIRFTGTFTFGANTLKLQKRIVGQGPADWVDYATGITALPYTANDLPENTELEFRMVSSADASYTSNIVRAKTYAQAQAAPDYPAPISLSGAPDESDPTTKINCSAISKGNVDTDVYVDGVYNQTVSAVAVDGDIEFTVDEETPGGDPLSPDTEYLIEIQHDYGSDHLSTFIGTTVSTEPEPTGDLPPTIDYSYYALSGPFPFYALYYFTPHGGSGTYLLETREITDIDPDPDWEVLDPAFPTGIPQWGFPVTQIEVTRIFEGRMKRNDVSGYSNVDTVYVPPIEEYGGGYCFVGETLVTLADGSLIRFDELFERRAEFIGKSYVKSFDFLNRLHSGLILAVTETVAFDLVEVKFKGIDKTTVCKPEHRFWAANSQPTAVRNRFAAIKDLQPGDRVNYDAGEKLSLREIESITPRRFDDGVKVYNLSVKIYKAYFADGSAVSNFKEI